MSKKERHTGNPTCLQDLIIRRAPASCPFNDDVPPDAALMAVLRVLEESHRPLNRKEISEAAKVSLNLVSKALADIDEMYGLVRSKRKRSQRQDYQLK